MKENKNKKLYILLSKQSLLKNIVADGPFPLLSSPNPKLFLLLDWTTRF